MDAADRDALLDALLDEQSLDWRRGRPAAVEALLAANPGLAGDDEAVLELLLHEFLLRRRAGERADVEEFARRFPRLADRFRRRLALHHDLDEGPETLPPAPLPRPVVALQICGALAPEQLDSVRGWLRRRPMGEVELGRELIAREWLTAFQVNRILRGGEVALGDYLLLRRLGAGGMGQVYQARHRQTGRVVAVKVIRGERAQDSDAVRRFLRESKAVLALDHPNVIKAVEAGRHGETHFLAMEFVDGMDAAALLARRGALPVPAACEVARQAALGLQHAHERGIVHRDVKPSNLLLARPPEGESGFPTVKVLDLGLARRHDPEGDASTTLTEANAMMGTPDYVAPEQIRDAHGADARSDLYSLGCSLYHLLAGRPPFTGQTLGLKLLQHQTDEPEPIERLRPEVPPAVACVVRRLMAKRPEDRFRTAAEAAAALLALLRKGDWAPEPFAGLDGEADEVIRAVYRWRGDARISRRHLLIAGGAGAALLAVGGVAWRLSRPAPAPPRPPQPELSPLRQLSRASIPDAERLDWQPSQVVGVLGEHRGRHWWAATCLAISPDGKMAASGGWDNFVRLWHLDPGRPVDLLCERAAVRLLARPLALAFVEDGATLLGAHDPKDGLWRLDVASGRRAARPGAGGNALSADGRYALHSPIDGEATLFDAHTGKALWRRDRQKGPPNADAVFPFFGAAFRSTSAGFFLAGEDHVIRRYELKGNKVEEIRRRYAGHEGFVGCLSCSADGKVLLSASYDGTVRLWDVDSGEQKARGPAPIPASVALSPDGRLAVVGGTGEVSLGRTAGLGRLGRLAMPVSNSRLDAASFTPSGDRLLTACDTGQVGLWGVESRQSLTPVPAHPWGVYCVALSGDGRRAFTGGQGGVGGRLWEIPSCRSLALASNERNFLSAAFSPDPEGRFLLASAAGQANLYDGRTLDCRLQLNSPAGADARVVAFRPGGEHVAAGGGPTVAGRHEWAWAVRMWKTATGEVVHDFIGHTAPITGLSFSADGKLMLTVASATHARDPTVRLWDVHEKCESKRVTAGGLQNPFTCAALSPDGRLAACGSYGVVYVWDMQRADAPRAVLPQHDKAQVLSLAWSPDGGRFFSCDGLGRVFVYDRGGKHVGACKLPGAVYNLAVASDGEHLLTANANGTAYVLRLPLPPAR
jgi:WD40 repeat protein